MGDSRIVSGEFTPLTDPTHISSIPLEDIQQAAATLKDIACRTPMVPLNADIPDKKVGSSSQLLEKKYFIQARTTST